MNPLTGELLGPGSSLLIGSLVSNAGTTNGIFLGGEGIVKTRTSGRSSRRPAVRALPTT